MVLDEELLRKAKSDGEKLAEAERASLLSRAEYHSAIRRLHLGGGSLREIAEALSISHQRVAQIVADAGGSWWGKVWRTRRPKRDAVCTFCDKPPSELAKLLAGPDVYICDGCVSRAQKGSAEATRRMKCSFCGLSGRGYAEKNASICVECLRVSREILDGRAA